MAAPYPGSKCRPPCGTSLSSACWTQGEVLIDDIRMVESPDGAALDLIQQGTFESGMNSWRFWQPPLRLDRP